MPDIWEYDHDLDYGDASDATADPDNDGLNNLAEFIANTNPQSADTDGDGLTDSAELNHHNTSPTSVDSDNDGHADVDSFGRFMSLNPHSVNR